MSEANEPERASRAAEAPAIGVAEHSGWRGMLREFATIVAGVLVALAGQAWWTSREDSARERDYLRQLLVDTRANERQLASALAFDVEVREAQRLLAVALYAPRPLPSLDSLRALFKGPVFSSSNIEPRSGTYTALLSSGDIRLIRTDTLRAAIVAYSAQLQSDNDMLRLYFEQAYLDPGRLATALPFVGRTFLELPDSVEDRARLADTATLLHVRENATLAGEMFALQVANNNRIAHLRNLLGATRDLRRMLEREAALEADLARFAAFDRERTADSARRAASRRDSATARGAAP